MSEATITATSTTTTTTTSTSTTNPSVPAFPRLSELAAANPGFVDSNASLGSETSEAAREEYALHFLTSAGKQVSSPISNVCSSPLTTAKRKKKKAVWSEKYENTAVVIGPVATHDLFKELIGLVKEKSGEVKSHYYREEQKCGFIYFHSDQVADKCKQQFDQFVFDGVTLRAKSPSTFFANQEDVFPDDRDSPRKQSSPPPTFTSHSVSSPAGVMMSPLSPAQSHSQLQSDPSSTHPPTATTTASNGNTALSSAGQLEPTPTLVIKNLCFGLKQEKLLEFMATLRSPPQSVSYHYDNNGLFRGVAFAKYTTAEQAAESLVELDGKEIGGRKLRVEFKRRTSSQVAAAAAQQQAQSSTPTSQQLSSSPSPAHVTLTPVKQLTFNQILTPQKSITTNVTNAAALFSSSSATVTSTIAGGHHLANTGSTGGGQVASPPSPVGLLGGNSSSSATTMRSGEGALSTSSDPHTPTHTPPQSPPTRMLSPLNSPVPASSQLSSVAPRSSPLLPSPLGSRNNNNSNNAPSTTPIQMKSNLMLPSLDAPPSLFKPQGFSPIVIRDGLEFEDIPPEPMRSNLNQGPPPPMSSFKAGLAVMPVLRAGLEFA